MEPARKPEPTPVDDVRLVRENLAREAGNDIGKLIEHANRVADELREKLGLKHPEPPPQPSR